MSFCAGFLPSTVFLDGFPKDFDFLYPEPFERSRIFRKCLKNWMISPAFGVRFLVLPWTSSWLVVNGVTY